MNRLNSVSKATGGNLLDPIATDTSYDNEQKDYVILAEVTRSFHFPKNDSVKYSVLGNIDKQSFSSYFHTFTYFYLLRQVKIVSCKILHVVPNINNWA